MQGATSQDFEPQPYCVVCEHMSWDEQLNCCTNFGGPLCPLQIQQVLEKLKVLCVVV